MPVSSTATQPCSGVPRSADATGVTLGVMEDGCPTLRIHGHLDADLVQRGIDLLQTLDGDAARILVELTGIGSEAPEACEQITRLHDAVRAHGRRSAYLATQPRYRGMVLYALRHLEDDGGRAFSTRGEAHRWLHTEATRFADLVTETLGLVEQCQQRLKGFIP